MCCGPAETSGYQLHFYGILAGVWRDILLVLFTMLTAAVSSLGCPPPRHSVSLWMSPVRAEPVRVCRWVKLALFRSFPSPKDMFDDKQLELVENIEPSLRLLSENNSAAVECSLLYQRSLCLHCFFKCRCFPNGCLELSDICVDTELIWVGCCDWESLTEALLMTTGCPGDLMLLLLCCASSNGQHVVAVVLYTVALTQCRSIVSFFFRSRHSLE